MPKSYKVLVVDDEKPIRDMLLQALDRFGKREGINLKVEEHKSGDEAWKYISSDEGADVDLIISDIMMPGIIDGIELAKKAKAKSPEIKIILITGRSDIISRVKEVDEFFGKPFSIMKIMETLKELLLI